MRTRIIGWLLAASAATFGSQTDPKSKASIEGQVVSQATGAPLKNATVKLQHVVGYSQDPLIQQANEEGRFRFTNLQTGDWEVSADRRGFVPGKYGGRKFLPQGSRISLTADQQIRELVIKLVPQATIAGRVLDDEGEPVEGARVAVLKAGYANGILRWSEVASATTLDNGEYRIPRVAAGPYLVKCTIARIVRAPSSSGIETGYVTTYHPNATEQSLAAAVDVQDGSEIGAIDIRVATTGVFHVRGRFPTTDRQGIVQLVDRSDPSKVLTESVATPPGYLIDFPRIPPGSYTAYGLTMEGKRYRASQPVDVRDQDVDSLVLNPAPADEVQGDVKLKPDDRKVTLSTLSVVIQPIGLGTNIRWLPGPVKIGDDLRFRFLFLENLHFVSFSVEVSRFPEGCYLASVRYGGKEVPDSAVEYINGAALEITIGTDGARLDGNALNQDDTPFEGAVVALISTDGKGAPRSMMSGPRGAFHFTGVPPGAYKLMAWDDVGRDDIENPDFIKRFESQGTPVKLSASGTATVSPKVISQDIAR